MSTDHGHLENHRPTQADRAVGKPPLIGIPFGDESGNRKVERARAVRVSIFLSHSSIDKPFARRLARDLDNQGVICWLDEGEIKIGDYLIEKLKSAIGDVEYLAVILSPEAVASAWVQREVEMAMSQDILGLKMKILPHCCPRTPIGLREKGLTGVFGRAEGHFHG